MIKKQIFEFLKINNFSLAVAESCTGGYLANFFTDIPGISAYFKGGIIAYNNEIKNKLLKVKSSTLNNFSAVSSETVIEMAENLKKMFEVNISISVSGYAGPNGGDLTNPVGTVFFCIIINNTKIVKKYVFKTNRTNFKKLAVKKIINHLLGI
jgi:PncC family amidohydrolase